MIYKEAKNPFKFQLVKQQKAKVNEYIMKHCVCFMHLIYNKFPNNQQSNMFHISVLSILILNMIVDIIDTNIMNTCWYCSTQTLKTNGMLPKMEIKRETDFQISIPNILFSIEHWKHIRCWNWDIISWKKLGEESQKFTE